MSTEDISTETKLIVASNLAVAQVVMEMRAASSGGTLAIPIGTRLPSIVKGWFDKVESMAAEESNN